MPKRHVKKSPDVRYLKTYTGGQTDRVALPLGGIGTGGVSLGGRGDLRDWEVMSRPGKGYYPAMTWDLAPVSPFFAVRVAKPGSRPEARLLEGPYADSFLEGAMGTTAPNHGMPRFAEATFHAAYPFGKVALKDRNFPIRATLEAFNPFVPGDSEASALPLAAFCVTLHNPGKVPLSASVCLNLPNFIGDDGEVPPAHVFQWSEKMRAKKRNLNHYRDEGRLRGIFMDSTGLPTHEETNGTIAMATDFRGKLSHRTSWLPVDGGDSRQEFWDDFLEDGTLENHDNTYFAHPCGTLCLSMHLPAGESRSINFYLAWHFPNRMAWTKRPEGATEPCGCAADCTPEGDPDNVGNFYARHYRDAWDVLAKAVPRLPALRAQSVLFNNSIIESDLPEAIKEAALFNLSTLRSPTAFRIASGHLCGWEGVFDHIGCCAGSCTHVWNYETATGALFADLARGMREVEFRFNTDETGRQSFRTPLPFGRKQELTFIAADGQMGTIVRAYREWQRSGDREWLASLWPHIRAALEFCWVPGGWDADRDGMMEGCQHNTMDVEYFGPNPQMTGWYLAALEACVAMARAMGDEAFADECARLRQSGAAAMEREMFNGEYFEHRICPTPRSAIAPGLLLGAGAAQGQDPENPTRQLGAGCLVDQLVGIFQARLNRLETGISGPKQKKTLRAIFRHNFRPAFTAHFNHLRSYVAPDDAGLVMASYPRGDRPQHPFPYWNEVMTGFEYSAAGHMLMLGMEKEGLRCIEAIRARYDGKRRNPYNEAECGFHYARAMASWACLEGWTGFHFSAWDDSLTFAPREGRFPWSDGVCFGTVTLRRKGKTNWQVELESLGAPLRAKILRLDGIGEVRLRRADQQTLNISAPRP